ncbi:SCO family protein [Methylobacterium planeticum]|uniref:SCO family protein n=1 Tax=Methylobacterium planeticum TaxID=2615211 RepID=A0A6N6MVK2_9HYPH|nr:SCO family protein [Methylobacterium planeticum]KAB1072986.1 SCO family protein [Methylobacterium planeticum]
MMSGHLPMLSRRPMSPSRPRLAPGFVSGIVLGLALATFDPAARASDAVTVGGPFTLKAPDGTTVTEQTYRGKWLLVYFGYTSCPEICPTTLFNLAAAMKHLGSEASNLQPIFITLDPERDTPVVMGEYVRSFDPRIVGLSGDPREIEAVIRAYGAYVARHAGGSSARDDLLDHSNYIYLMNPAGLFVRAVDPEWSGEEVASKLREIMARHQN